ncbi:DUF6807 family protein [Poritiphilus flavus]|uniref:Methane oxygenase PmoA n=1 Tax=Poritiphilus flavus TaxID=2697053 RepID=A0A6L9E7X3_9FLAO|nr:DUF6807 family protein [Poritiphilus flavus]NAS10712.1 hypothetical protein [Poritiphilus flavus]
MRTSLLICFLIFLSQSHGQELNLSTTDQGFLVTEGDKKVFFYQSATKSQNGKYPRAHYVHPLYGMDGHILTEDFPEDHPHHRGLFWAWHQVYIGDKRVGDSWDCSDFIWEVLPPKSKIFHEGMLEIRLRTMWKSPLWTDDKGAVIPFVMEDTRIRVFAQTDNYRIIDLETWLLALEENVRIGGSEDAKGYGGFSLRTVLPQDISFSSGDSPVAPKVEAVEALPWLKISGSLAKDGSAAGIVMLSYQPDEKGKEKWILRKEKSMQNIPFPGRDTVRISDSSPTSLKYRLIIYKGDLSTEKIEAIYKLGQN